jgi:PAS domain S-box-containing protein
MRFAEPVRMRALLRWLFRDPLSTWRLFTPRAGLVLVFATLCGVFVIGLWRFHGRMGPFVMHLFAKEGPLEDLTFALELAGAVLCFMAAWRWPLRTPVSMNVARILVAALGGLLFLVGMEEINWGQTLFDFATPDAWSRINYQHETSIHNLVDKTVLTRAWKIVAALFALGVLAIVALAARFPRSLAAIIAPPPTLVPLALCAAYAGLRLHPEMIELLMSVFFTFYSYRMWTATRRTRPTKEGSARLLRYGVATALVAVLLYRVNWSEAATEWSRVSTSAVVGAFIVMAIGLVVSAWKWRWALRLHDLNYGFPFLLRTLCIGFFFNSFLPTAVGGDAYRVLKTMPPDGYRSRALSAVVVERAVGLLALLVIGGIGAFRLAGSYDAARDYFYVLLVLLAAGAAAFIALQGGWLERFAHRWRRVSAVDAIHHNLALMRHRPREWLGLVMGSFVFQAISIGAIFVLFGAVSNASPSKCALIAAAVGLAAMLPISINGIGVMEGALVAAAVALKLDYEQALIVAFARRALTIGLAVPCGVWWLTEARHAAPAGKHVTVRNLADAFRRSGFRGLIDTLQVAELGGSPTTRLAPLAEPDVPLADEITADPEWAHTQLLEYTHDAIIIWEMKGSGILYWNRAAEQLYGYSRAEAHGRTTHELLKTELAGGVTTLEENLAKFGVWVGELHHTTRDGRRVDVEGRLALMSQPSGRWLVLEVNRDITDRKAAEAARAAIEQQLAELLALRGPPAPRPPSS